MLIGTGLSLTAIASRSAGSGGGGDEYVADAVHFDGTAFLRTEALSSIDNGDFSYSLWFKLTEESGYAIFAGNADLLTQYTYADVRVDKFDVSVGDSDGSNFFEVALFSGAPASYLDWNSLIVSFKTDLGMGLKIAKVYLNRSDITGSLNRFGDSGDAFNIAINGLPFVVGGSFGSVIDIADLRIFPGVSFLTAGDIAPATIALFADSDNKPVAPAVATAALGAAGAILMSGNAAGFVTNQGTGGAFVLTGALTDAPTSPSD